jgi:hypothetical protein
MRLGVAHALVAIGVLLVACSATPQAPGPPAVRATASGDGNSVEVTVAGGDVALDVWSNRGIGAATVELVGGPAPSSVELRLHLYALEELRINHRQGATVISLASGPGHAVTQRVVGPDGAEEDLDPTSPGWLTTRIVAAEPDPPFPLREGHIAITLPPALLTGDDRVFSLQWVDFFR